MWHSSRWSLGSCAEAVLRTWGAAEACLQAGPEGSVAPCAVGAQGPRGEELSWLLGVQEKLFLVEGG